MDRKLPKEFYADTNVTGLARALLGKVLVTRIGGVRTAGIIVETEAYDGPGDRASHAFGNRRTRRTEPMFALGGIAYVYQCYGIHFLFNVVTGIADRPQAVLVRGLQPLEGSDIMAARRGMDIAKPALTAGPGSLCRALGINASLTGTSLLGDVVWIEDAPTVPDAEIAVGTRVGVAYAGDDALLPYRFWIRGNAWVSRAKGL